MAASLARRLLSTVSTDLLNSMLAKLRSNRPELREKEELRAAFYAQFMSKNDLTFDVGANVGNRTAVFARLSRTVVAVEPQDRCLAVLRRQFGRNPHVRLVGKAVGPQEGQGEILLCNANTMSSFSPAWVSAVRKSGRFPDLKWEHKRTVTVTTLDKLITEFGLPAFIKIDVEGYEYDVLQGLSQPVKVLSFEFVPEYLQCCYRCVDHLLSLGTVRFNYSMGESMQLALATWVDAAEIKHQLLQFTYPQWGDIYVRFEGAA